MANEVEEVEVLNPGDDVRNDVAAALKQLKGEAPAEEVVDDHPEPVEAAEEAEAPVVIDKADHPSDPARYADGTFKPVKTEAAPEKVAPVEKELASTDTPAKASEQVSTPAIAPPVGWTPAEKAEWNKLPPAIQTAVSRREAEISRGGQQWSEEKRRYETIIAPVAQEARRLGMETEQAINTLMSAHHLLERSPAEGIARLAAQYGVDLTQLASNPPVSQPQAPIDPIIPQVVNDVNSLKGQIAAWQSQQLQGQIAAFASRKDKPHFEKVRADMARIANTLPDHLSDAEILEQAYEQAIWVNPEVRNLILAEQQAEAQRAQAAALQTKATQARKAAVSIKGSSNGAAAPSNVPQGVDVYDDVRNAIAQLRQ